MLKERIEKANPRRKLSAEETKRLKAIRREATFNYNRAEGYSSKGKHGTAKTFYDKSESLCEDALEVLQEILHYGNPP